MGAEGCPMNPGQLGAMAIARTTARTSVPRGTGRPRSPSRAQRMFSGPTPPASVKASRPPAVAPSNLPRIGATPRPLPVIAVLPSFEDEPGIAAQAGAAEARRVGGRGRRLYQAIEHDALEIRRRLHPVRR